MVEVFYPNYKISDLMEYIFLSDWFYDERNIAAQIKSPIELLVSMYKLTPYTIDNPKRIIVLQKVMGQVLFQPPNVAGWPGDKAWIDSNTLMFRLRLPSLLFNGGMIESDVPMMENQMQLKRRQQFFKAEINWKVLELLHEQVDEETLELVLFGRPLNEEYRAYTKDREWNKHLLKMMSLPEYQMC
jgi:hypothetical protein